MHWRATEGGESDGDGDSNLRVGGWVSRCVVGIHEHTRGRGERRRRQKRGRRSESDKGGGEEERDESAEDRERLDAWVRTRAGPAGPPWAGDDPHEIGAASTS